MSKQHNITNKDFGEAWALSKQINIELNLKIKGLEKELEKFKGMTFFDNQVVIDELAKENAELKKLVEKGYIEGYFDGFEDAREDEPIDYIRSWKNSDIKREMEA
jgi:hypothetical protein